VTYVRANKAYVLVHLVTGFGAQAPCAELLLCGCTNAQNSKGVTWHAVLLHDRCDLRPKRIVEYNVGWRTCVRASMLLGESNRMRRADDEKRPKDHCVHDAED
jgi:hypothetical protein